MTTKRTITGLVLGPDGDPATGMVTFTLMEPFETSDAVVPAGSFNVTLVSGEITNTSLPCPDNGATGHWVVTGAGLPETQFYLAYDAAPISIMTILTIAGTNVAVSDLQTLMDQASVFTIRSVAVSDDIEATDEYVRATVAGITLTLPAAVASGKPFIIMNTSAGSITLAAQAGETVGGAASKTIYTMCAAAVVDAAADTWDVFGG